MVHVPRRICCIVCIGTLHARVVQGLPIEVPQATDVLLRKAFLIVGMLERDVNHANACTGQTWYILRVQEIVNTMTAPAYPRLSVSQASHSRLGSQLATSTVAVWAMEGESRIYDGLRELAFARRRRRGGAGGIAASMLDRVRVA